MKKIFPHILFLIIYCGCAKAQDAHFSQFFNTPLYNNPANAGNGIEYMRATLIYRKQSGAANPFVTQGFMVDKKVNNVGFGLLATKTGAGIAGIKQVNFAGVLSYNQPIGKSSCISTALQAGMLHKSVNPAEMTFDSQYSEDTGFDPTVYSGELFSTKSITRPDLGMGFMFQRGFAKPDISFKPFAGFSLMHINHTSETFIADNNRIPVKTTINFGAGWMVKENMEVTPSVVYLQQDHAHEFTYGATMSFIMSNQNKFQVGLFNRTNSAFIAYAGYQVNRLFIGTSYDVNGSANKEVNGSGSFEITLTYMPKEKKKKKPEKPFEGSVNKKILKNAPVIDPKEVETNAAIPDQLSAHTIAPDPIPVSIKEESLSVVTETLQSSPVKEVAVANEIKNADEKSEIKKQAVVQSPAVIKYIESNPTPVERNQPILIDKTQLIKKFDNIEFETGTAHVKTTDVYDVIEYAIDVMYEYPKSHIVLSGHTDSEGDDAFNTELSEKRTEIVKLYLVEHGIDESRIASISYGESMPLLNNDSPYGKARNRRVEVNILK